MTINILGYDVTIPAWAVDDEARAWFAGFALGCILRVIRAALRWFKRVADDRVPGAGE